MLEVDRAQASVNNDQEVQSNAYSKHEREGPLGDLDKIIQEQEENEYGDEDEEFDM
jgi:hypothetical protein